MYVVRELIFKNLEYESIIHIKNYSDYNLILLWWFEDIPRFCSAAGSSSQTY